MNYDKLSRSLRYYYEKGIMQKVKARRVPTPPPPGSAPLRSRRSDLNRRRQHRLTGLKVNRGLTHVA